MKAIKILTAVIGAALSALYLLNVGAGVIEFIPDNIPVAGNLDELVASLILLRSLIYLGVDPLAFREKVMRNVTKKPPKPPKPRIED